MMTDLQPIVNQISNILDKWDESSNSKLTSFITSLEISEIVEIATKFSTHSNFTKLSASIVRTWLNVTFKEKSLFKIRTELKSLVMKGTPEFRDTARNIIKLLGGVCKKNLETKKEPKEHEFFTQLMNLSLEIIKRKTEPLTSSQAHKTEVLKSPEMNIQEDKPSDQEIEINKEKVSKTQDRKTIEINKEVSIDESVLSISLEAGLSDEQIVISEQSSVTDEQTSVIYDLELEIKEQDKPIIEEIIISDIPPIYQILKHWNDKSSVQISQLLFKNTISESLKISSFLRELKILDSESQINYDEYLKILSSVFYSAYFQNLDPIKLELLLNNLIKTDNNTYKLILLKLYTFLFFINMKMSSINEKTLRKTRERGDLFNINILIREYERNKLMFNVLDELRRKNLWDLQELGENNEINVELLLELSRSDYGNTLIGQFYNKYGLLHELGISMDGDLKDTFIYAVQEEFVPIPAQIEKYKITPTAQEIIDIFDKWFPVSLDKKTKDLDEKFKKFLPDILNNYFKKEGIEVNPLSGYSDLIRDVTQSVFFKAMEQKWDIEMVSKNLALTIILLSPIRNLNEIEFAAYIIAQEFTLGSIKLKYKFNDVIRGIGRSVVHIMLYAISDPKLSIFLKESNYKQLCSMFFQGIWDSIIETYESASLAESSIQTFVGAIQSENDNILMEKRKLNIKEKL